jgi:hypothetical protein
MNNNSDIKIKKQTYESGIVYNINKLNFNWKELKKFTELEKLLQSKKTQKFIYLEKEYKTPVLLLDEEINKTNSIYFSSKGHSLGTTYDLCRSN